MKANKPEDIWKSVNKKGDDGCWEWVGYKNKDGYGRMKVDYKMYHVHRIVYELTYGPIPDGLLICHRCNNRSCCNPNHLYLGTQKDNMEQCVFEGRLKTSFGEKHGQSKLNEKDVKKIKELYNTKNYSQRCLGKLFNISHSEISRIINNQVWKHILMEE